MSPSPHSPLKGVTPLHENVVAIVNKVQALDIRGFEDIDSQLHTKLTQLTLAHLDEAIDVVVALLSFLETQSLDTPLLTPTQSGEVAPRSFEFEIDTLIGKARADSHREELEQVVTIASLANNELRERKRRVLALAPPDGSAWYRIAECDSALRRICKSLAAIEYSLCRAERLSPKLAFQTELEMSLDIRLAYVRFRREIMGNASLAEVEIEERLQTVSDLIAAFVRQDIYSLLRVRDRSQLREIQTQILAWGRDENRVHSAGVLLWNTLVETIHGFCLISQREEIVAHDSEQIAKIFGAIFTSHQALSEASVKILKSFEGLDPEIDELLQDEFWESPAPWRSAILRLMTQLGQDEETSYPFKKLRLDISDFF